MTIDEVIEDLIYDAQCNRADLDIEWAERNEQLAEWLEELKSLRDDYWKVNEICKMYQNKNYHTCIEQNDTLQYS